MECVREGILMEQEFCKENPEINLFEFCHEVIYSFFLQIREVELELLSENTKCDD
jgi:hypothetical protein